MTVEQVHNEFFTASDRILDSAKSQNEATLNKSKTLKALGFVNSVESNVAERYTISKELADLVFYYRVHYPNNKFISEDQVTEICNKYRLVLGGVERYTGFVPAKNLSQIEAFKLKPEEKQVKYYRRIGEWIQWEECKRPFHPFVLINLDLFNYCRSYILTNWYQYKKEVPSFMICAPKQDMKLSASEMIFDGRITSVPDPVVLQPVRGGYLIVTAWGEEASDPIVVNEIHN